MSDRRATITVSREQWEKVTHHIHRDHRERAAFYLTGVGLNDDCLRLLVQGVILVPDEDLVRGPRRDRLEIKPAALLKIINIAAKSGQVLVEVHNHERLFDDGKVGFSMADEIGFNEIVPFMLGSSRPGIYGAAVVGPDETVAGRVWVSDIDSSIELSGVEVLQYDGRRIHRNMARSVEESDVVGGEDDPLKQYARQIRAFGQEGQRVIGNLRVGIVGLGGIGSLMASYLSRLGVIQFVLIDQDHVDEQGTNLNRLDGASESDAINRTPKVDVAARNILTASPHANVRPMKASVFHPEAVDALIECDLIVGCTDNESSRFAMNDLSLAYLRPYIDLGSEIHPKHGMLGGYGCRYTFVMPGEGCLLCAGAIDAAAATQEFTPSTVVEAQVRDGYIAGTAEVSPAVMPLNATAASLACGEILVWATGIRPVVPQVLYDGLDQSLTQVRFSCNNGCDRCRDLLGTGDAAGLKTAYSRYADDNKGIDL